MTSGGPEGIFPTVNARVRATSLLRGIGTEGFWSCSRLRGSLVGIARPREKYVAAITKTRVGGKNDPGRPNVRSTRTHILTVRITNTQLHATYHVQFFLFGTTNKH